MPLFLVILCCGHTVGTLLFIQHPQGSLAVLGLFLPPDRLSITQYVTLLPDPNPAHHYVGYCTRHRNFLTQTNQK